MQDKVVGMRTRLFGNSLAAALVAFMLGLLVPLGSAWAEELPIGESFVVDGVTYAVTDAGEVSVGTGKVGQQAISREWSGALIIPETVAHDGESYRVTSVAAYACAGCTQLTEVSIPASVINLGFNSFGYCGTLDDSGAVPVYGGLRAVTFAGKSNLEFIGENAFIKDYALQAFTIPASVENISMRAFQDCFSFERFECEEGSNLKGIAMRAFAASMPVMDPATFSTHAMGPDQWPTTQSEQAPVKSYAHLKSVHLPASLTTLGNGAFENQRALVDLEWADGCEMTIIGEYAFQYCESLEHASVPAVLHAPEGLGPYAFQYCVSLKTFTYKGFVRAPYSGYSERGLFRGCGQLESVIYLTDKYHLPHGTSTTIDTGRSLFTDCNPNVYYRIVFYRSKADAEEQVDPIGEAIIRDGTPFSSLASNMIAQDELGPIVYSGAVPALEEGYGWASSLGGGSTPVTNAVAAYPAKATDLEGAALLLSETEFIYSGQPCTPDVVVKDAFDDVVAPDQYVLEWERKDADGNWVASDDSTSAGTMRVRARAIPGGSYSNVSSAVSFTITRLVEEDEFYVDGMMYTILTTAESGQPTVMLGDSYGYDRAVDAETAGVVTVPEIVYPSGSAVGYTVTQIAPNAFGASALESACGGITEVVLPGTIQVIGGGAFRNMTSLSSIVLPASLSVLKANAFANDKNLETVRFEGAEIDSIGIRAFANCESLSTITLPAIKKSFGSAAFENCVELQDVVFTGDVVASASNQFSGSDFVQHMVFCGNNPGFDLGSFTSCYARVSFEDAKHTPLGSADILVGTKLAEISSALPKKAVFAGAVPGLPKGSGPWVFAGEEEALTHAMLATAPALPASSSASADQAGTTNTSEGAGSSKSAASSSTGTKAAKGTTANVVAGKAYTAGTKTSKATYKVISVKKRTVAYKACKSTSKKSAVVPATVTIRGKKYTVVKVLSKAFASYKKLTTVTVKSKKITSFANAFKQSKVKTVKIPKTKRVSYKKLLTKKRCGRTVKIKLTA